MVKLKLFALAWIMAALFTSCVPAKKLEDAKNLNSRLMDENSSMRKQIDDAVNQMKILSEKVNAANEQVTRLANDTAYMGEKYRKSESLNKDINELYEQAIQQNQLLVSKTSSEKRALNDSLVKKQQDLYRKGKELDSLQQNLVEREQKLAELQSLLKQKDSATSALKTKLANALLGFEKSDLTVEQRNGKVYVSMAEKLLFKSGSTSVDPKGVDALKKLASVLKENRDLTIEVEGHTDNVPLAGTGAMKDNWDLSVLRATSIIRILTDNGVDPKQITASGRGEYFPVASNDSAEGKAKNRRTEIILTPRLDQLMKILGN